MSVTKIYFTLQLHTFNIHPSTKSRLGERMIHTFHTIWFIYNAERY